MRIVAAIRKGDGRPRSSDGLPPLEQNSLRLATLKRVLLSLTWLLFASPAAAQLDLELPACAPTHIDVPLLRELLAIELGDAPMTMTLSEALCDAHARAIDVDVRSPSGVSAREVIELAASEDPHEAARAAALAIAERVPHMRAALEPVTTAPVELPRDLAVELASPVSSAAPEGPAPAPTLWLPPTFGVAVRARALPVLPSWALGLRLDLGASFDPTWAIRGELFSTWTRATAHEGDIDAIVLAAATALTATVLRAGPISLAIGARAEAGALFASAWSAGASAAPTTTHPWVTAGGEIDLVIWLGTSVALVADVAVEAIVLGTRLVSWPSGTQIDYSILSLDLGAGLRIPL
jgi:hypothetical protein